MQAPPNAYTIPTIPSADPLVGMKLGEYQLIERIGQGGMGVVYRGVHPVIKKRVAVKVMRGHLADDPGQVERLKAEAEAVNHIGHRGIVDIFGFGTTPMGHPYVVMEFLEGQPLSTHLRDAGSVKGMPVAETLDVLEQLCSALSAAHAAGVIHRDLKPSNVFIVRETGGARFVKLLDFGIAKRADSGEVPLTRPGMVVGTLEFMSPEQCQAQPASPQSDLYALGVMAFEMLTGRRPFVAANDLELMKAQVEKVPQKVSTLRPDCPPRLSALVAQCLEKDPKRRPASALGVGEQLRAIAGELTTRAAQPTVAPRRGPGLIAPLAAAGTLVAAGGLASFWLLSSAPAPPTVAVAQATPPAPAAPPEPQPAAPPEPPMPQPKVGKGPAAATARPKPRPRGAHGAAAPPTVEQLRADIQQLEATLKATPEPDASALLLLNTLKFRASGAPNPEQRLEIAGSLDVLRAGARPR